ncbi:MAG: dihydropteroate synthase-like protein [Methanoregulaceae archaeon]|nr:dihydropteroate synthase-like protein [Methanoregulaceae archaeon]
MRILLPTGSSTYQLVRDAAAEIEADVVVTGEIASFLAPGQLRDLLRGGKYDMAIVSGMCTADFSAIERETGVPIFRGPRHAADLGFALPIAVAGGLSRSIPADEYLARQGKEEAYRKLSERERMATPVYSIRSLKIGGGSRMKVLAEIMDAHRVGNLPLLVDRFFCDGADIVDLGFGFDATAQDVERCFRALEDVDGPLSVDTQDAELLRAALFRADIVLSLQEENIPRVGEEVGNAGAAAVVVPGHTTLAYNVGLAREAGIECIIADPLLQPVGSGFAASLAGFPGAVYPTFFGAGNVTELLDADSIGMNALLAGIAHELGASLIFTSEHSDKTRGSVAEMRRATEMMAILGERPYPKDLGIDLLVLKEKRRRLEPPVQCRERVPAIPMTDEIRYDPKGNFRIGIEHGMIIAEIRGKAILGTRWGDILATILKDGEVSLLDHAGYLGKELYKAELALRYGRSFEQDGEF